MVRWKGFRMKFAAEVWLEASVDRTESKACFDPWFQYDSLWRREETGQGCGRVL